MHDGFENSVEYKEQEKARLAKDTEAGLVEGTDAYIKAFEKYRENYAHVRSGKI